MLKIFLFLIMTSLTSACVATDLNFECAQLKKEMTSGISQADKERFLKDLRTLLNEDSLCAKNILGIAYYNGDPLDKDTAKAYAIFYDLAGKGYPPSLFNMAYFFIEQKTLPPNDILGLLKGIMATYSGDQQWGIIAADARELGYDYLQQLTDKNPSNQEIQVLRDDFIAFSRVSIKHAASKAIETRNQYHAASDVLLGLMALGAVASSSGLISGPTNSGTITTIPQPSPRFYNVLRTGNPNVFYLYGF